MQDDSLPSPQRCHRSVCSIGPSYSQCHDEKVPEFVDLQLLSGVDYSPGDAFIDYRRPFDGVPRAQRPPFEDGEFLHRVGCHAVGWPLRCSPRTSPGGSSERGLLEDPDAPHSQVHYLNRVVHFMTVVYVVQFIELLPNRLQRAAFVNRPLQGMLLTKVTAL